MTDSILKPMEQPAEAKKQRERSSIGFPYGDLDDGGAVAQAVHELGDRCSHEQLAPKLGHTNVDSGTYGLKVATSRQFGLVTVSKGEITLSPLGQQIVDPTQAERGRAEAFLTVPLYKALYDKCRGYTLPPTNLGLEAVLVELGVAEKQKDKARQALQRSADQAGFFYQGRDRLVMPAAMNRQPDTQNQVIPPREDPKKDEGGGGGGNDSRSNTRTLDLVSGGRVTLTLSVDLFDMSDSDRTFVLDLVDKMKKYSEQKKPLELPERAGSAENGAHAGISAEA